MDSFWSKKALYSFSGAALVAVSLFILIAAAVHYGISNLLGLTALAGAAISCCRTLFSWCLVSPTMFVTVAPWVGFAFVIVGALVAIFKAVNNLVTSRNFLSAIRAIPADRFPEIKKLAESNGVMIAVFEDDRLKSAFTLGLVSPKIYISTWLIKELTQGQLEAVIHHELHHAKKKDPLKLFALSFVADMFFFVPLERYLTNLFYKIKELAADEKAACATGRPVDLAQALLKMAGANREPTPVGIPVLDGGSLISERIKELLEPGRSKPDSAPVKLTVVTATVVVLLTAALAAPIYAGSRQMEKCNHKHSLASNRSRPAHIEQCETVCDTMAKR